MYPGDLWLEGRIPDAVRAELERRGHKVAMRGPWSMNNSAGILVEAGTGTVSAGADPRCAALALAW
jgi:gamma-glutamyltranspeptidase/glutathione hydrolase